ncbi:MAG: IS21 family transposase [Coriobacteriia bacterium]
MNRHHSIREISRRTGWSRQTVRKHLAGAPEPPTYRIAAPRPRPVIDPFVGIVEQWMADDLTAPRKQRHTAKRVYDRLVDEYGFTGSEITVRRAVARIRGKRIEAFVPLEAPWGHIAQTDFGTAVVMIGHDRREVALFCMRAKASKVPFVIALPTERLEALLAGHVAAFEFFGGVFHEIWYDNPKTAVTKILAGPHRIEHERLSALRACYLFDSSFCTPACGNEKGSVENLVGYVRRNALVPHTRSFPSLDALNVHLRGWCERERQRHAADWAIEAAALSSLPTHPFSASVSRPVVVGKTSMVTVDRVRYSVPVTHVGRTLRAESFVDRVEVFDGSSRVALHVRSYTRNDTVLDLAHYLDAFERKPRAALSCAALGSADPVFTTVRDMALRTPDGHHTFARVLLLAREFGLERLADALRSAVGTGPMTPERVRQLALNAAHTTPEPICVPSPLLIPLRAANIACYDELAVCAS